MNTFLYFLPGLRAVPPHSTWSEQAWGHVADAGVWPQSTTVERGPDGHSGVLFGMLPQPHAGLIRYVPDEQRWTQHASGYWVGMWKEKGKQPTADDLGKREKVPGETVFSVDGQKWLVPVVRSWGPAPEGEAVEAVWRHALEQCYELEGEKLVSKLLPSRHTLFERAELTWFFRSRLLAKRIESEDGEPVAMGHVSGEEIVLAIEILKTNYRLGLAEASLLGILTDAWVHAVLDAANDVESCVQTIKKKRKALRDGAAANGGPGSYTEPEATSLDGHPPAPNDGGSPLDGTSSRQ